METERKRRWVGREEELPPSQKPDRVGTFFFLFSRHIPASINIFIFFGGCPWGPQIVLVDDRECLVGKNGQGDAPLTPPTPVDLDLEWVLGKMPQKVWEPGRGVQWCSGLSGTLISPCLCYWCALPSPGAYIWPLPFQEFFLQRKPPVLQPLALPPELSVRQALDRVLRLPAVASKRYLTNKVVLVPHLSALAFCTVPCRSSWLSPTGVS